MLTNADLRHTALLTLLCGCLPLTAMAAQLNGESLVLTDLSPYIAFVDTSVVDGSDWVADASQDHFYIHAGPGGLGGVNFLDFNSVSASTALGLAASAPGDLSIALGYFASAGGDNSTALGRDASSAGGSSTALGRSAFATGSSSIALGYLSQASNISSVAIGQSSAAAGAYGAALGYGASAAADNGLAVGFSAKAEGINSTALGAFALANQLNTVVLGSATGVNGAAAYANVGMGTSAPTQAVDVERSGAAARFQLTSFTAVAEEAPQYIQRRARGTRTAPTAVQNNDNLGLFSFRGYNGTAMGGSRATITAQAAGNFTGASTPTRLIFATTPVGSTTPQQVLVITPDGKVQVNGQNLTVPDYVFEDGYQLMPLEELQAFIDTHGHLPGIPSADEVTSEGLDLAGSHMSHLQKIEELTLYTLKQESRLETQQARIAELEALQERVAQLETQELRLDAQQKRIAHLESLLKRALATLD